MTIKELANVITKTIEFEEIVWDQKMPDGTQEKISYKKINNLGWKLRQIFKGYQFNTKTL